MTVDTLQAAIEQQEEPKVDTALPPVPTDPDEAELAAAQAELKAPTLAEEPAPDPAATPSVKKPADTADTPAIPKPRFDEVVAQRDQAAQQAAYWKGVADSRASSGVVPAQQTPQAPAPVAKTAHEQVADIRSERKALAGKFDNGDITAAQWEEQRQALEDRELAIREESQRQPAPDQTTASDLYLDQLTVELEDRHPYAKLITDPNHWSFIETEARRSAAIDGINLTSDTRGTFELRRRMAELTDRFGPSMTGKQVPVATPAPVAANPANPSLRAQARDAKLDLAASMPPNIHAAGNSGTAPAITESDILKMSDDDIAALPEATRRAFLQKSSG